MGPEASVPRSIYWQPRRGDRPFDGGDLSKDSFWPPFLVASALLTSISPPRPLTNPMEIAVSHSFGKKTNLNCASCNLFREAYAG